MAADDPEVKSIWRRSWCRPENVLLPCGSGSTMLRARFVTAGRQAFFRRRPPCPAAHVHDGGGTGAGRASVHRQPCGEG